MQAEIVSVGTELLLGHIVDTNAAFLAQELTALGIDLFWVSTVGDNQARLVEVVHRAWNRSDLTIITGGIGPTEDDLTREAIAETLGEEMGVQPDLERELREFFDRHNRPMPERNVKQATLIPSASALPNPIGTAPGWWVERDGHAIVTMPGVPVEMYRMWREQAIPRILGRQQATIYTRILKVLGLGESHVEERITHLLANTNPTIATYAKSDGIHVRLTAKAATVGEAAALIEPLEAEVRQVLGDAIYGIDDQTVEGIVGGMLRERGLTLATIEGMTGGLAASGFVDAPNSAEFFVGGIVADSPASCRNLGIDEQLLVTSGLESSAVARALAAAVRARLGADIGLAIRGGEPAEAAGQRPGSLHIAIDDRGTMVTESALGFGTTRGQVKGRAALAAADLLRRYLQGSVRPDRASVDKPGEAAR